MITIADELIERGRQQGLSQGLMNGERTILKRQLQRKFGSLSPKVLTAIERAEPNELEEWADRVLIANTVAEVLGEDQ